MLADFMIVMCVILAELKFGDSLVNRPNVLLLLGMVAMTFAEAGFSTILHHHYSSIDKVLARTTALSFTFGIMFFLLCTFFKWTFGIVADGKTVGMLVVYTGALLILSRFVERFVIAQMRKRGRNSRTICFVGKEDRIEEVMQDINSSATTGLRFVGYFAPCQQESLNKVMPYLGDYATLEANLLNRKRFADEVYCALPPEEKELSKQLIHNCMHQASHFYYVPTFISDLGGYLKPSMIGEQVVFANFTEPLLDPKNRIAKRTFDVVCSGTALVILLPFFPIIAIIIKCCSPGPIFFKQARTGYAGKEFMMLKFRSMHVNADADKVQAKKDDPRKYPFGDFMRKTSIDELPQLWNIFIGDMSIVGPRPHMLKHTEEYRKLIDEYMVRHYIRPGLTGWAQTTGFRGETSELWQMEGRVKRDIWYIQNWTFWLDIRIIFRTVSQVISKDKQAY